MAVRTTGCAKESTGPGARTPAATRDAAARPASPISRPATDAASGRVACSRTATRRASAAAAGDSLAKRSRTEIATPRGDNEPTRSACALSGAIRSDAISRTSSRSRKGLPPVALRQASANPSSDGWSSARESQLATAGRLNGRGARIRVAGSSRNASISGRLGREPSTTAIGRPSRRGARNDTTVQMAHRPNARRQPRAGAGRRRRCWPTASRGRVEAGS